MKGKNISKKRLELEKLQNRQFDDIVFYSSLTLMITLIIAMIFNKTGAVTISGLYWFVVLCTCIAGTYAFFIHQERIGVLEKSCMSCGEYYDKPLVHCPECGERMAPAYERIFRVYTGNVVYAEFMMELMKTNNIPVWKNVIKIKSVFPTNVFVYERDAEKALELAGLILGEKEGGSKNYKTRQARRPVSTKIKKY